MLLPIFLLGAVFAVSECGHVAKEEVHVLPKSLVFSPYGGSQVVQIENLSISRLVFAASLKDMSGSRAGGWKVYTFPEAGFIKPFSKYSLNVSLNVNHPLKHNLLLDIREIDVHEQGDAATLWKKASPVGTYTVPLRTK